MHPSDLWFLIILSAIISGVMGGAMTSRYNKAGIGFLVGFLFGPLGIVGAWIIRDNAKQDELIETIRRASEG